MERLYKLFGEDGIDGSWLYSLTFGNNTYYSMDTELLSYYYDDGWLILNAKSIQDARFSMGLLRDMLNLTKKNEKVVLYTTLSFSKEMIKRHNLIKEGNMYYKGVTYE